MFGVLLQKETIMGEGGRERERVGEKRERAGDSSSLISLPEESHFKGTGVTQRTQASIFHSLTDTNQSQSFAYVDYTDFALRKVKYGLNILICYSYLYHPVV